MKTAYEQLKQLYLPISIHHQKIVDFLNNRTINQLSIKEVFQLKKMVDDYLEISHPANCIIIDEINKVSQNEKEYEELPFFNIINITNTIVAIVSHELNEMTNNVYN